MGKTIETLRVPGNEEVNARYIPVDSKGKPQVDSTHLGYDEKGNPVEFTPQGSLVDIDS